MGQAVATRREPYPPPMPLLAKRPSYRYFVSTRIDRVPVIYASHAIGQKFKSSRRHHSKKASPDNERCLSNFRPAYSEYSLSGGKATKKLIPGFFGLSSFGFGLSFGFTGIFGGGSLGGRPPPWADAAKENAATATKVNRICLKVFIAFNLSSKSNASGEEGKCVRRL